LFLRSPPRGLCTTVTRTCVSCPSVLCLANIQLPASFNLVAIAGLWPLWLAAGGFRFPKMLPQSVCRTALSDRPVALRTTRRAARSSPADQSLPAGRNPRVATATDTCACSQARYNERFATHFRPHSTALSSSPTCGVVLSTPPTRLVPCQ